MNSTLWIALAAVAAVSAAVGAATALIYLACADRWDDYEDE